MSSAAAGAPPRRPAGGPPPPGARKPSQASLNPGANPRFYDGPTVGSKANEVKVKAKEAAKVIRSEAKKLPARASRTVRRHPWSFISLLTTVPFLITISLLSTVMCPPPAETPSIASRYLLQPFGLGHAPHQQSELVQTLCYPSNVYHREFLQPYVYPVIDNVQDRVLAHPLYTSTVEPAYTELASRATRVWQGPVRPIVRRIQRALKKAYLTFVHPHVPYLRAKAYGLTAPYTSRVSALHHQHVAPHIATANSYAQAGAKNAVNNYNYVVGHPYTKEAGRRAHQGYQIGRQKSWETYKWSKPHAERAGREGQRILEEVVGPRVYAGLRWAGARVELFYNTYLEPSLGPHIQTTTRALQPYTSALHKNVYIPYIRPALESILPMTVFAPEKPKTFWSLLADILPDVGGVEGKGQMKKQYTDAKKGAKGAASTASKAAAKASRSVSSGVKEAKKSAQSVVDKASKSVSSASKSVAAAAGTATGFQTRDELNKAIKALETKVDQRSRAAHDKVRKELVSYYSNALVDKQQWIALHDNAIGELERDSTYVLTGLDKLYTTSTSLSRDQVFASAQQAESRLGETVRKVKTRVENMRTKLVEKALPLVKLGTDDLDALRAKEVDRVAEQMKNVEGVSTKEWTRITNVRKSLDDWENKIKALQEGTSGDKQFSDASVSLPKAVATLNTHLDDMFESFRDQLNKFKKTAMDRVEAREAIAADSASVSSSSRYTASSGTQAANARLTILPVVEAAADAAGAGGAILSKGQDQILDAYSQVAEAATASENSATASSVVQDASAIVNKASKPVSSVAESVVPTVNNVASSIESAVHAAADSASSIGSVVSGSASSLVSEITETAQTAYKSAASAVGVSHSPDGAAEHLESIANVVAGGYASVVHQASGAVHDATRSAVRAVGATPSPESVGEHVESLVARGSESVESVASAVSQAVGGGAASASSVVHDATRSAMRAVGATPSPEGVAEHAESIAAVILDSVNSAASVASATAASVLANAAASGSSVYADAAASGSSVYDAAASSGSSAADAASSAVHDATRSAIRAVGATPSPETPHEHADSAIDAAGSVVSSGTAAFASQASELAASVSSILGALTGSAAAAPTDAPLLSAASAYLASLAGEGAATGAQALASGSSILLSLKAEASKTVHEATRAASRAAGATPRPETGEEYLRAVGEKVSQAARRVREEL